jgi:exodeoxyribonuclease VII large subunit
VMRHLVLQNKVRMERMTTALESLSPLAILERGYALLFDSSGQLLKDARRVEPGQEISARLARGELQATVTKKRE